MSFTLDIVTARRGLFPSLAPGRRRAFATLALLVALAPTSALGAGVGEWVSISPPLSVRAIAVSPATSSRIAVGIDSGYYLTTDGGATWTRRPAVSYPTSALAFDPADPSIVYGAMGWAVTRSTDGGGYYEGVLPGQAYCLAVVPTSPTTVYAGTVTGLYRSRDKGLHWTALVSGTGSHVRAIAVHPADPNLILAMVSGELRKSKDGGATWSSVGAPSNWVDSIAFHPTDPSIAVAISSRGLFRTSDGAATWTRVADLWSSGFGGAVVADREAPGRFYAAGYSNVLYSVDDGAAWSPLGYGPGTMGFYSFAIDPSDHTRVYAGSTVYGVFTTTVGPTDGPSLRVTAPNGGEVWAPGTKHPITWTTRGSVANVKIEYSTVAPVAGQLVDPIVIVASTPNTGSYPWVVPQVSSGCWVRVSDAEGTVSDIGDAPALVYTCGYTELDPPASEPFGAMGGRGAIQVTQTPACTWDVASDDPWIFVVSGGSSWGGPGEVTYSVAPNLDPAPRVGRLRVGSASFEVRQSGGDATTEGAIFVPVVLDVFGVGSSHFTSELTLTNRSSRDASVRLTYTGAPGLGGGSGSATLTLPAGRQVIEPDALAFLGRLGVPIPASGNRGGTLAIGVRGATSLSEVAATVRTTTAVADGRAGLAYSGIPVFKALAGPLYVCGLRDDETDRSNLALQNAGGPAEGTIRLRIFRFGSEGFGQPMDRDVVLPPGGFAQVDGIMRGYGNGYVKVERVEGSAPWYAYGVVNDRANSDGSFIPPHAVDSAPIEELVVPAVLETGEYATELVVTNLADEERYFILELVSDQIDDSTHAAVATLSVRRHQQVVLPNVLQYLRDSGVKTIAPAPSGVVGSLFVRNYHSYSLSDFVVGARTSSSGGGGRYGLFYPATPTGRASVESAWIHGLQQNATNRSNLAILNTGQASDEDDLFDVDVFHGETGRLVHTERGLVVGAKRRVQVDAILSRWAPGVADGYVHVRRTSGDNPFIAYGVINDGGAPGQRSDDGAFLPASD